MKTDNKTRAKNILLQMQQKVGDLIVQHISENMMSIKLRKLQVRYNATSGDGSLLLSKILPKRCKFFEDGKYSREAYVAPVIGAEDYLVVFDCKSQKITLEERPIVAPFYY